MESAGRIRPCACKVIGIRLSWWKKNLDEIKAAYSELQAAKVGRRARLKGTVEALLVPPVLSPQ